MDSRLAGLCGILVCLGMSIGFTGPLHAQQTPATPRLLDSGDLRSISLDLHGRPPFAAERELWIGKPLGEYVEHALAGEELWSNWVQEQLYYFLLIDNFRPRSERVIGLSAELSSKSIRVSEALHSIALCTSFDRRNPGPDTFVTVVMEQYLGMRVQKRVNDLEAGKRLYDGRAGSFLGARGNSQSDVVRIALADKRMFVHFLSREYQRLLRGAPPKRSLSAWARGMQSGELDYRQILREWLLSDRYLERLANREQMTNRIFVHALFVDLSDANPKLDEARRLRNALDGLSSAGPLRSVIARLYIDSGRVDLGVRKDIVDPTKWIMGLFERLLGRPATPEELAVFVVSFRDPACSPATIVYALISHPEYQTW